MNTRMAKRRTTPMLTIVHTMLVRVGSTVCCGKVGSADDGATTSGSGGNEPSAEGCVGPPASGLSTLMAVSVAPVWMIVVESSRHIVAGWSWHLHDGRAEPRTQEVPPPTRARQRLAPTTPKRLASPHLVILPASIRPGGGR